MFARGGASTHTDGMGLLKRVVSRHSSKLWELETRVMHRMGLARPPIAVQWLTTMTCDLACPHCYVRAGKKCDGELTTDEVKTLLIDPMVSLGCTELVIAGGEPLLRKDLGEILTYASDKDISWSMHTHGGLVRRCLPWIESTPPAMVAVSLDGPQGYHDAFRGKENCHARALDAMQALKDIGVDEVVAGTTVTRQNADLLVDMIPVVAASAADSWGLHLIAPEGRGADDEDLLPTAEQLRRVAQMARRARSFLHVELDNEWGGAGANDLLYRDTPFSCGAGRFSCVVSSTGDVTACTTSDPGEAEGNIRLESFHDIWVNRFDRFRCQSAGADSCADSSDCWLQTRNGRSPKQSAFLLHPEDLAS